LEEVNPLPIDHGTTAGASAQLPTGTADMPKSGLLAQDAKAIQDGTAAAIKHASALGEQVETGLNVDR
jgi:hypothetical protein